MYVLSTKIWQRQETCTVSYHGNLAHGDKAKLIRGFVKIAQKQRCEQQK